MSSELDTVYFCKKRKAMNDNGKINRRDFIKSSVLTGGVLFAQAANEFSQKAGDNPVTMPYQF